MRPIVLLLVVLAIAWAAVAQSTEPIPADAEAPVTAGLSEQPWTHRRVWIAQFGTDSTDYIYQIAAAGDGGVFVVGSTEGDLAETNLGDSDAYLVRLDPDGTVQWQVQFGTAINDVALAAAEDDHGNCFIAGVSGGEFLGSNLGGDDTFVAKYDADGVVIWTTMAADPADEWVHDIAVDADGACFVATVLITEDEYDDVQICVIKIDETGTERWRQWIGPYDGVDAMSLRPDGLGGCRLAAAVYRPEGRMLMILALDDYGAETARAETELADDLYVSGSFIDADGNVFFSGGDSEDEEVFDSGDDGEDVSIPGGSGFVFKLSPDGVCVCAAYADMPLVTGGDDVVVDADGNAYLTGDINEGSDTYAAVFDPQGFKRCAWRVSPNIPTASWTLDVGADGTVFVSGETTGDLAGSNQGSEDVFVVAYGLSEVEPSSPTPVDRD